MKPSDLMSTPLLPEGYYVPKSRKVHPSTRMRQLLDTEPYLFGPGVYDPMTAMLVMYYGFKAVYFSGYSFAIGHVGTTDMDIYHGTEIANAASRTVSALRKFQLTLACGDPDKGVDPKHVDLPPVIVDMDGGYGNIFNVMRTTENYVKAGVAAAHIEDQVLPKRCGHIGGKAVIPVDEMLGKLQMMRAVADDAGNEDFVIIARTDAVSAVEGPEFGKKEPGGKEGVKYAVERACRYLDSGVPDLIWCEFPTGDRELLEMFSSEVHKRHPQARFAFNYSSSFKWFNEPDESRLTFAQLGEMGNKFLFITLGAQHATSHGLSVLLQEMQAQEAGREELGYVNLQRKEWKDGEDFISKSHHAFSGVPFHHLIGAEMGASRLGKDFVEDLGDDKVV